MFVIEGFEVCDFDVREGGVDLLIWISVVAVALPGYEVGWDVAEADSVGLVACDKSFFRFIKALF